MLTNTAMKSDRYLRWHERRQLHARIVNHLSAGGTVVMATHLKAWKYGKKHVDMFTVNRSGVYVEMGKSKVCIDYCGFRYC